MPRYVRLVEVRRVSKRLRPAAPPPPPPGPKIAALGKARNHGSRQWGARQSGGEFFAPVACSGVALLLERMINERAVSSRRAPRLSGQGSRRSCAGSRWLGEK